MPIIDLLQSFTSKHTQIFSAFLTAYTEIRRMKDIETNISIIAQCMLSEYNEGSSKCLSHYVTNELDKLLLQLNQHVNLESFYCSIVPLHNEVYLDSEFFRIVWKYGTFTRLARLYAEKCVAFKLFNHEFGSWVVENFFVSRDCLIILCEMEEYLKLFNDLGLDYIIVNRINSLIKQGEIYAVDLLDFLVYYSDKNSSDLLDDIVIDISTSNKDKTINQNSQKHARDIPQCASESNTSLQSSKPFLIDSCKEEGLFSTNSNASNSSVNQMDTELPDFTDNQFPSFISSFLLIIFRRIKSILIRQKVINTLNDLTEKGVVEIELFIEMLIEFSKIDIHSVAEMLNEFQDSYWKPCDILEILAQYSDLSNLYGKDKKVNDLEQNTNHDQFITFSDMNVPKDYLLEDVFHDDTFNDISTKLSNVQLRYLKKSPLIATILTQATDIRIFALLLFVNESIVFNNFKEILSKVNDKRLLCQLIVHKINTY
ncbi:hypothetical protein GINT2_001075 [Glugoides intestinalis]